MKGRPQLARPPPLLGPFSAKSLRKVDIISYEEELEVESSSLNAVLCDKSAIKRCSRADISTG
jgi:hypothetical protein